MHHTEAEIANALDGKFYRVPNTDSPYTLDRRAVGGEVVDDLIALYVAGKTVREIGAALGISPGTVGRSIRRLIDEGKVQRHVRPRVAAPVRWTLEDQSRLVKLYRAGATWVELTATLGRNHRLIRLKYRELVAQEVLEPRRTGRRRKDANRNGGPT